MKMLRTHKIMLSLLPVTAFLQFVRINTYSFWFDESYTSALLKFSPSQLVDLTANDVHPPLYYLLLKGWSTLFGSSDVALRSFSALTMLLASVVIYFLILKLTNNKRAAIASFVAVIFSPFVIRYSQEARMYGLSSLLVVTSSYVLVHYNKLRTKTTRQTIIFGAFYAVLIAAIMYTHYFASLIILVHAAYLWAGLKGSLTKRIYAIPKAWIAALVGALVLYLPWVPTLLDQLQAVNNGFWIPGVGQYTIPDTFNQLFIFTETNSTSNILLTLLGYVGFVLVALATKRAWQQRLINKPTIAITIGSVAIVMTVLIVLSAMPSNSSYYYLRYFSQYTHLFFAGVGLLLFTAHKSIPKSWAAVFVGAFILLQSIGIYNVMFDSIRSNNDAKPLMQQLEPLLQEGDIVLSGGFGNFYDAYHYLPDNVEQRLVSPHENYGSLLPIERLPNSRLNPQEYSVTPGQRIWFYYDQNSNKELPNTWLETDEPLQTGDSTVQLYIVQ